MCPIVLSNAHFSIPFFSTTVIEEKFHVLPVRHKSGGSESENSRLNKNIDQTKMASVIVTEQPRLMPGAYSFRRSIRKQAAQLPIGAEMIPIIVHEIRTSLSSVYHFLELVRSRELSEPETIDLCYLLDRQMHKVSQFVDQLIMWGKVSVCDQSLSGKKRVHLRAFAAEILSEFTIQASLKQSALLNEINPELSIYTVPEELHLVIRNLVGNAVKFTENGMVSVALIKSGAQFCFSVTDNGRGLSKERIHAILRNDTSISDNGTRNETGTGLGLIIVKNILQRRQSSLFIESQPGRTQFSFPLF